MTIKLRAFTLPIAMCMALILGCSCYSINQAGDVKNVEVTIKQSENYSEREIQAAMKAVKKTFRNFEGCKLINLRYEGTLSDDIARSYRPEKYLFPENIIVLYSDFYVDETGGDGSFSPNDTYKDWNWILVRESCESDWVVIDWGY